MIKVEVIENFSLKKFNELKNLERFNKEYNEKGSLYVGDTFECTEEMGKYLTGDNTLKKRVVKILEVIPVIDEEKIVKKVYEENKPKKKSKKK